MLLRLSRSASWAKSPELGGVGLAEDETHIKLLNKI
jgi:hypothetical protein